MNVPGTRQKVARIIAQRVESLMRPQPAPAPMPSPCEPGFMIKKQAS